ncbi:hypothetical protein BaRGS_00022974, partial [Batillaria attramentaria]
VSVVSLFHLSLWLLHATQDGPMEQKPSSQAGDTGTKISDSNYGSLITESSSSCLSLLSESDFLDEPSTSGCSSEMASMAASRAKKRQKVKEFLRELKSMVPQQGEGSKVGTLSTLGYVVSSMRKITEEQKQDKGQLFKAPSSEPVALPSFQCSESVDFRNVNDGIVLNTQSELTVAVSLKNHVVLSTSTALMDLLGYPHKDVMTVNSYINNESTESTDSTSEGGKTGRPSKTLSKDPQHKFFYARIRRFRNLSAGGYNIGSGPSHTYFKIMVTSKSPEQAPDVPAEDQKMTKRCMMLYFAPMVSPYKDGQLPPEPEQRTFSLRHSLFCTYTYTHANTVALLGFLPQDIIGTSIFDYYHPDDLQQLLDIYKKVMHSMGQPFRSGSLRIKTCNGTYVKVQTEWSSFTNPWDHKLEFIIAQHTIIKPPENPNVFEEAAEEKPKLSDAARKLVNKITDVLQRPMSLDNMPPTPSDSAATASQNASASPSGRDVDIGAKSKDKTKQNDGSTGPTSPSDISSSLMDEKSISSLYNQLNYSLNIKKFLLSHPKCFPVSDEDSSTDVVAKDDSEEDMNEEEEMQVAIPVVRPPSCGSSTQPIVTPSGFHNRSGPTPDKVSRLLGWREREGRHFECPTKLLTNVSSCLLDVVCETESTSPDSCYIYPAYQRKSENTENVHVSEPGFHEEIPSPPSFHEDAHLTKEAIDNQLMLTEDSLRKHTKAQELLYLQEASIEQPQLLMRPRKMGTRRPKRSRPAGHDETDVFKFARGSKGPRGQPGSAGAGLFMPNFPMTSVDIKPTPTQPVTTPVAPHPPNVVGVMPGHFQPGMGVVPQLTMLPVDPTTGMHLQPFLPTPGSSMQWPYYPQSGYSLLPQVMAGFYQPVLQPVPMTPVTTPPPFTAPLPCTTKSADLQQQTGRTLAPPYPSYKLLTQSSPDDSEMSELDENRSKCCNTRVNHLCGTRPWDCLECRTAALGKEQQKNGTDSDNPPSSMEDTTSSSIQYLLDAVLGNGSSPNEETDEKNQQNQRQVTKLPRRRPVVPPWLQGINWTPEVRMIYKMPMLKMKTLLKKDREALKKLSQSDQSKAQLEELLEELDAPDCMPPLDEDADYLFYPECTEQEADGERTPCAEDSPPMVSFDLGNAEAEEATNADSDEQIDKPMEVVLSGDVQPKLTEESADAMEPGTDPVPEVIEKVHSPGSQGSAVSSKEESAGGTTSPTPPPSTEGAKNDKSPKDSGGSWSDEASDKGSDKGSENSSNHTHKALDEQSFTSKMSSSDLTPSDERSTEDASSSLKESDMSTPKGSFASSNDKLSTDSGAESVPTPKQEFFEKLFVPLKVRMCKSGGLDENNRLVSMPFWQTEAHMTKRMIMQYNLIPLDLNTILANDRRRLAGMKQPHRVNCQLLELLQERDASKAKVAAASEHAAATPEGYVTEGAAATASLNDSAAVPQHPSAKQLQDVRPKSVPVEKQLLDKLQGMTHGRHSELWPGDIIMSQVFLPSELTGSQAAADTTAKSQDTEILDSVD